MAQSTSYSASDARASENACASTPEAHELSRRAFLIRTLCAGGVLAAGTTLAPGKAQADILDFLSKLYDFNPVVLNFAHEMEELQADFFERASISRAGKMLEPRARNLIYEIAAQDRAHFEFLDELTQLQATRNGGSRRTLQTSASRRPRRFTFPAGAFEDKDMLLPAAVELKELCVSAYHGAVHLITSNLLSPAAAVAGVDGRHLAVLREVAGLDPVPFSFENQVSAQVIGRKLSGYGFKGGKQQEG
ncbi:MAG TPA: ferritin-like domain-containing protein [Abditibacteriaceae bacterium]